MNYYGTTFWSPTDLTHYGVLGMKWGVRRYQNKDGSLTPAGKKHAARIRESYDNKYDPKKESFYDYYQNLRSKNLSASQIADDYANQSEYANLAKEIGEELRETEKFTIEDAKISDITSRLNLLYDKYMKSLDPILKEAKLSSKEIESYKVYLDDAFWDRIYGFGY